MRAEHDWLDAVRANMLRGDHATVENLLRTALNEYPQSFELRRSWAAMLRQMQHVSDAEALFCDLLREQPNDAASAFALADLLNAQCRTRAAGAALRTLFANGPQSLELVMQAVELLDDCDRKHDAAAIAEQAISSHQADARLYAYAGMLALQLGQFDRARERYLFALERDPHACEWRVPYGLAQAQHYSDAVHPDFARFRQCLARTDLVDAARSNLLFALGKACDDVGDFAQAASLFREGNAIAQHLAPWSRKAWRRAIEARLASRVLAPVDAIADFVPVFIMGMPRSGTTLTAELLSRFSRVCNRGEKPWIAQSVKRLDSIREYSLADLRVVRDVYIAQARQDDSDGMRWFLDKQPLNIRYVDLILALFPNARIIHCERDARDTALSLWMQPFIEQDHGYSSQFEDIQAVMRDERRLIRRWRSLWPDAIRSLRYEDLVSNSQDKLCELVDWLGVTRETAAASAASGELDETDFATSRAAIPTASLWQARQPIHTRSVARWRSYAAYLPELSQLPE